MIVVFFLLLVVVGVSVETWAFMMTVGMAHIHLLEAIHPISYGVSLQFILITLPIQVLGLLAGLAGDS